MQISKQLFALFCAVLLSLSFIAFSLATEDSGAPPDAGGALSPSEGVGAPPDAGGSPNEESGAPPDAGGSPNEESGAPPDAGTTESGGTTGGGVEPGPAPAPTPVPITPVPSVPGTTVPAPVPIQPIKLVLPSLPLNQLRLNPQLPLFMRSGSFPDSDCVRPGEQVVIPVTVQNTGNTVLKDITFMTASTDLGVVSSAGPFRFSADERSTVLFNFVIPNNAPAGEYYMAFIASNGQYGNVIYRPFSVGATC